MPIDSNVAIARGSAAKALEAIISARKTKRFTDARITRAEDAVYREKKGMSGKHRRACRIATTSLKKNEKGGWSTVIEVPILDAHREPTDTKRGMQCEFS